MLRYLPIIYDEEAIISILMRYAKNMGYQKYNDVLADFYHKQFNATECNVIWGIPVEKIYDNLPEDYPYEMTTFIEEHTIAKVYYPFISLRERKNLMNGVMKNMTLLNKYLNREEKAIIKYCSMCVCNDVEKRGNVYLHRQHQIPGILVCAKHKRGLRKIIIERNEIIDLQRIQDYEYVSLLRGLSKEEKLLSYKIAIQIDYILNDTLGEWEKRNTQFVMCINALRKGYNNKLDVDYDRIVRQLKQEISDTYFKRIAWDYKAKIANYDINGPSKIFKSRNPIHQLLIINSILKFDISQLERKYLDEEEKEYLVLRKLSKQVFREKISNEIENNPGISKREIIEKQPEAYNILSKYDSNWIFENVTLREWGKLGTRRCRNKIINFLEMNVVYSTDELFTRCDRELEELISQENNRKWLYIIFSRYLRSHNKKSLIIR